jgi:hypothetical protein
LNEKNDVCIRIIGKKSIDFAELKKNLPFDFRIHKKGELLHKRFNVENDVAILEMDFKKENLEQKIKTMINHLSPYKQYIYQLKKDCNIVLRIYIESIFAQMYVTISNEIITEISNIGLDIEFSVFSEGLVKGK